MKTAVRATIILVAAGIILLMVSSAIAQQEFPQPGEKYVNDFAGIFDERQVQALRGLLEGTEQSTTAEIAVVSVAACSPLSPGEYATGLFAQWEVGKAGKDNGLVILLCRNETKVYAVTGYGLEGMLPDSKLGRLLDEYYVPRRDAGNVAEGIISFTEQVAQVIRENSGGDGDEVQSADSAKSWTWIVGVVIVMIFIGFIAVVETYANKRNRMRWERGGMGGFSGGRGGLGGFGGGGFGGGG
ncbi:TPM domain-containing protein, partial [Candidatus Woesearchaeota archaeon]|nr:TPM domain-containing protein [Candidatus Woesearchaeota archaeon]